jgi:aspartate kinase
VEEISDLGKVSLVGAGMRSHPGVAAQMFRTLADEGINLRLISTSPIKVSCLIPRDDVGRAVRALHKAFSLGEQ